MRLVDFLLIKLLKNNRYLNSVQIKNTTVIFYQNSKIKTSGSRFWLELTSELTDKYQKGIESPDVALLNISTPFFYFLFFWMIRTPILIRVDGCYLEYIGPEYLDILKTRSPFLYLVARFLFLIMVKPERVCFIINFFDRNFPSFCRILLSTKVVYQSEFSKRMHSYYFPSKQSCVVLNGIKLAHEVCEKPSKPTAINLLISFSGGFRRSKRHLELVRFVSENDFLRLHILGYDLGRLKFDRAEMARLIHSAEEKFFCYPPYSASKLPETLRDVNIENPIYISFAYRDPCPNSVIEALSNGIPVVGLGGGGVPEILDGCGGELVDIDEFSSGVFSSNIFPQYFPLINYQEMMEKIIKVHKNYGFYKRSALNRSKLLDIKLIADQYAKAICSIE